MNEYEALALAAAAKKRRAQGQSNSQSIQPRPMPPQAQLQTVGPGPTGYISPDLYEMGAIGRRFEEGPAAIPVTQPDSDLVKSLGSGLLSGTAGLMDLPGAAFNAGGSALTGLAERSGLMSPEVAQGARRALEFGPLGSGDAAATVADMAVPGGRQYQPETTAGEYAKTVGEFLPATVGAGPAGVVMGGVVPALASEAAGQAFEGTNYEDAARLIGAVAAPVALAGATRKVQSLFSASQKNPQISTLKATKQAAYKAVDDAGEKFSPDDTASLYTSVKNALDDGNFVPEVDKQTAATLSLLEKKAGSEMTLGQLDKIRQNLWKRYSAAPNEVNILDAIDEIDNLVASRAGSSDLMQTARLANSRYKKAQLLDTAFTKAADQTASTGSGGNILNKYRQAVTSIINNPKQAKWFSKAEIDAMRNFVHGSVPENVLRRIGKLAPGGNGLMLALNLGAAAVNPNMLALTAGATAAKAAADSMATKGAGRLMSTVAGQPAAAPANYENVLRAATGAMAAR